jgi:hypothetical protein
MPFSPVVAAIIVESVNAHAVKVRSVRLSCVMLIGTIESSLRHASPLLSQVSPCDAKCGGQIGIGGDLQLSRAGSVRNARARESNGLDGSLL